MKKRKSKNRPGQQATGDPLPTQQEGVDRSAYPTKTHATFDFKTEQLGDAEQKSEDSAREMQGENLALRVGERSADSARVKSDSVRKIAARSREIFRAGTTVPRNFFGLKIAHVQATLEAGETVRLEGKVLDAYERVLVYAKDSAWWYAAKREGRITE